MTPAFTRVRRFLVALALAAPLIAAAPAHAVELGLVTDLTWGASSADQEREYTSLSDLGAKWIRLEVNWAEVEPTQGAYDAWSLQQLDAAVRRNRAAGRQVVIMIGKAPRWASGSADQGTPPRDPADYARFVKMIAVRYAGDGIAGYEIWNEENIGRFWGGTPDAAGYVRLLAAAAPAVRSADPDAEVVFGGLSTNDADYVRRAYAAGAKGLFDVMALHPYSCESDLATIKRTSAGVIQPGSFLGYRAVRDLMVAQGDAKPMWFTELGWSTTTAACGVTEAVQADRIAASVALMQQDPYVQAAMFYNLRNNYWMADGDTTEARYGLMTTDFRAKPAYATFKTLAHGAAPTPVPTPTPSPQPTPTPVPTPVATPTPTPTPTHGKGSPKPPKVKLASTRAARLSSGRRLLRVSGRVLGATPSASRVRVVLRRGHHRIGRVVVASRRHGHFKLAVRRHLHPGRWHVIARLAVHPQAHAARVVVLR